MTTPAARHVARLIPTAVGPMYAHATSVGITRLVRAGEGDDDEVGPPLGTTPDDGRAPQPDDAAGVPGAAGAAGAAGAPGAADAAGDSGADGTAAAERHLDRLADQLEAYFDGHLRSFDVPVDWAGAGVHDEFAREVYREIRAIGYGETCSYGQISYDAGRPRNARRVGRLCSLVPVSFLIPVHRVTRADGGLGSCPGFRRGLLAHEKRNIESAGPVAITPS